MLRVICTVVLLTTTLAVVSVSAQTLREDVKGQINSLEQELAVANGAKAKSKEILGDLEVDLQKLRADINRSSKKLKSRRLAVAEATKELQFATENIKEAQLAVLQRRRELGSLLGAMVRLNSRPPEALVALNEKPSNAVKVRLALRSLLPEIERRISSARDELQAAEVSQKNYLARQREAKLSVANLHKERRNLINKIAKRRKLFNQTETRDKELSNELLRLAEKAQSLDAFLKKLASREEALALVRTGLLEQKVTGRDASIQPSKLIRQRSVDKNENHLELRLKGLNQLNPAIIPVVGKAKRKFGEGAGLYSRGIIFSALPSAEVFAPYDGRVVYAGPFKGYATMALIEHGDGYHTLLTGLEMVNIAEGDWVLQGELIGALPERLRSGTSELAAPELYVEIRKNGKPIDPTPWFASSL
jgi:septal ring factor EnvC (AmiA/AmiB activator)